MEGILAENQCQAQINQFIKLAIDHQTDFKIKNIFGKGE
jgi:hypothetical protein